MRHAFMGWVMGVAAVAGARAAQAAPCDSNLIVVLDRSCSMKDPPGAGQTRSKWDIAVEAIDMMVTQYKGKLRFGLTMLPDKSGMDCVQAATVPIPVGGNNESAISTLLAATMPDGPCVTPIAAGVRQVASDPTYAMTYTPGTRRGFALLITDGMETCETNAKIVTAITDLYSNGYPTFVVGFGGAVDPAALNMFATAGGMARTGTPKYYQADTAASLQAALAEIAGTAAGDPEFGGCAGTPCPDGRCFLAGETCVNKHCQTAGSGGDAGTRKDGGAATSDGGAGSGDGGGMGGGSDSGCGCRTASGPAGAGGLLATLLLGGALAVRLGRRRQFSHKR